MKLALIFILLLPMVHGLEIQYVGYEGGAVEILLDVSEPVQSIKVSLTDAKGITSCVFDTFGQNNCMGYDIIKRFDESIYDVVYFTDSIGNDLSLSVTTDKEYVFEVDLKEGKAVAVEREVEFLESEPLQSAPIPVPIMYYDQGKPWYMVALAVILVCLIVAGAYVLVNLQALKERFKRPEEPEE